MASELRLTTLANNAGTESVDTTYVINGSAKAWGGDITDSAVAGDSFNVASITDLGTGANQPNWTNAFDNADYSSPANVVFSTAAARSVSTYSVTTAKLAMQSYITSSGGISSTGQQFASFGDLA